jgi:hypothetical protein
MPSRPAIALIFAFWFGTIGFTFYRDVWPRISASSPPALSVDLAEEASPNVWVKWSIYRGDRKIGRLMTHMSYDDADGTFLQRHEYHQLEVQFGDIVVQIPQLKMTTRVTRAGELREQSMEGSLRVQMAKGSLDAEASIRGKVVDDKYVSRCELKSSLGDLNAELEPVPVPVPRGQALNPLQVMSRIEGLRARQSWIVEEIDPLGDAIAALIAGQMKKFGLPTYRRERESMVALVSSAPENLKWKGNIESCWVIEYRGNDVHAKTWVRHSDWKVLRQEAFGKGERLTVERDE